MTNELARLREANMQGEIEYLLMCTAENLRSADRTPERSDAAFRIASKLDAVRARLAASPPDKQSGGDDAPLHLQVAKPWKTSAENIVARFRDDAYRHEAGGVAVMLLRTLLANGAFDAPPAPSEAEKPEPLTFIYRNWRGEISKRDVLPMNIRFGSSEWHAEPQWLLRAFDLDKGEEREFAMKDIGSLSEAEKLKEALDRLIEVTAPANDAFEECRRLGLLASKDTVKKAAWNREAREARAALGDAS